MTIESIEQLETALAAVGKHEALAATIDFVKAIQNGSNKYVKDLEAKESLVKSAEAARAEHAKKAAELETSIAEVRKELEEVRAKAEEAETNQKFQERMAAFDEEFELDDEDRKILASDVKALDTDEAFAAYMSKCKKLMGGKKKKAKADPEDGDASKKDDDKKNGKKKSNDKDDIDDDDDDNDDGDDEDKKGKKSDDAKAAEVIKTALASVTEDKGKTFPASSVQIDTKLLEDMGAAFGASFKIDGKSAAQRATAKAKK